MREIARRLTQKELEAYVIPDEMRDSLALTTLFEGDDRVFVLYVPGEQRENARVIARTTVNAVTGVASVDICGLDRQ
ncbi:MAG TPA: hypothetical protein DEO93_06220 [Stenotrophomonas sp.]|nr:hypothetical protein [Stenotrophomonas sp.]